MDQSTSVVSELEETLLKDPDAFSYFMLLAFEASGLFRFALLLLMWPVIRLLEMIGREEAGLKVMVFVAVAGVRESEIKSVAGAVLPKFYMEDVDTEAWKVFSSCEKRVVVTKMPRVMVERFAKKHLRADKVIGCELVVNRFGLATGFVKGEVESGQLCDRVAKLVEEELKQSTLGLGRPTSSSSSFLSLCKKQMHPPLFMMIEQQDEQQFLSPLPVIFHDGRLIKRPMPSTALLILVWMPLGILLAVTRITVGLMLPMWAKPYASRLLGGKVIVKGNPPPPPPTTYTSPRKQQLRRTIRLHSPNPNGPVVLSIVLGRRIPAVTYTVSRFSEIISPIPTVRLTRIRHVDAEKIKRELSKGDLVVCPEGTTCREPFLLRFSALFAELTDRIVPVAMNYRVGFFHATTAKGCKALDPIFFFMNPRPVYEVTFLNQLPMEATCSSGKSPQDVANYVQRILAATLGFECTNFTRKDKYTVLAGNDGTFKYTSFIDGVKKVGRTLGRLSTQSRR